MKSRSWTLVALTVGAAIAAVCVLQTPPAKAQQPTPTPTPTKLAITGPAYVQHGSPAFFRVPKGTLTKWQWELQPPDPNVIKAIEDDGNILLGMIRPTAGRHFIAFVSFDGQAFASSMLDVGDKPAPSPTPEPSPTPPNPVEPVEPSEPEIPPGRFGLAKFAYEQSATYTPAQCKTLIDNLSGVVSACRGDKPTIKTSLAWAMAVREQVTAAVGKAEWNRLMPLLQDRMKRSTVNTNSVPDLADATEEVVAGLSLRVH